MTETYVRPTHEQGYAAAEAIAAEYGIPAVELRWFAADHYCDQLRADYGDDHGFDCGSSDVSIHLSSLGNYEPEILRAEAERIRDRNRLIATVAAASGMSLLDAEHGLRALFAPKH